MTERKSKGLEYALEKSAILGKATQAARAVGRNTDVLKGVGMAGMGASLPLMAMNRMKQKIQNDTRRKALIEDLYTNDPIISEADREDVLQYYATILSVAPSISLDKNVVKELLQNFIKFGRVDIQTIKTLADTEKTMKGNHESTSPIPDTLKSMANIKESK